MLRLTAEIIKAVIEHTILRRRACRVLVLLAALVALQACTTTAPGGDPGNRRLHRLARNEVFRAVPADSSAVRLKLNPARLEDEGFHGKLWHGPSVVLSFTSHASARIIYRFYDVAARRTGWQPDGIGTSLKVTDVWKKTLSNGNTATLLLLHDVRNPHVYTLSASI